MRKLFLVACFASSVLFAGSAYDEYFEEAGRYYNIPSELLKKIAKIESDLNPNLIGKNSNKTKDYGIMQINTIHLPQLKAYGIDEQNIMNPRINIFVGAALLQYHIRTKGYNWEAIGRYHSNTPQHKQRWLSKLSRELKEIKKPIDAKELFGSSASMASNSAVQNGVTDN